MQCCAVLSVVIWSVLTISLLFKLVLQIGKVWLYVIDNERLNVAAEIASFDYIFLGGVI